MNLTTKQIFNGIAIVLTAMVLIFSAGRCSAPKPGDSTANERIVQQLKEDNKRLQDSITAREKKISHLDSTSAKLAADASKSQASANILRKTNDRLLDSLKKVSQTVPDTCKETVNAVIGVAEGYRAEGDTLRHTIQIKNVELSVKDSIISEKNSIIALDSSITKNNIESISRLEKDISKLKHPKFMGIPLPSRTVSFIGGVVVTLVTITKFGLVP